MRRGLIVALALSLSLAAVAQNAAKGGGEKAGAREGIDQDKVVSVLAAHRSWLGRGIARARAVARAQELGAARKKQVLKIAEDLVAYTEEAEAALKLAQAGDFQQAWLEYRTLQRTRRSARAGMSVINILSQAVKVKQRAARNSDNAEVAEAAEKLIDLLEKKADLEVQLAEAQAVFERVAAEQRPRKKRRNKEREDNPQPQDVPPAIEAK